MKVTVNSHKEIIEKLSKFTFVKKDGNKLIADNGFSLWWDFEFKTIPGLPIQLLIRVCHEDAVILTWGCTSNEDTEDFANFIQLTEFGYIANRYNQREEKQKTGIELFNNL